MEPGFMYCFKNPSFPGFLMVGVSEQMSDETMRLLNESNYSYRIAFKLNFVSGSTEPPSVEKITQKQPSEKISVPVEEKTVSVKKDPVATKKSIRKGVSMAEFFTQGQGIRHRVSCPDMVAKGQEPIWTGSYDAGTDSILYEGTAYPSLSSFAESHYKVTRPDRRNHKCSGWDECEYQEGTDWLRCKTLRKK